MPERLVAGADAVVLGVVAVAVVVLAAVLGQDSDGVVVVELWGCQPQLFFNVAGAMAAERPGVFNTDSDYINNSLQYQGHQQQPTTATPPLRPTTPPPIVALMTLTRTIINQHL